jgi:hypothetical protein
MLAPNKAVKESFLKEDLYDALRWLFVGAVTWEASRKQPQRCENQDVLGMYTSLVQARALYEFFYAVRKKDDDARVCCFPPSWKEPKSPPYLEYMDFEKPANKRVFHLVYKRAAHAGGPGHDGPDHLKNQLMKFAKDLHRLTEVFIGLVEPALRGSAPSALQRALNEAQDAANYYGIVNPFADSKENG